MTKTLPLLALALTWALGVRAVSASDEPATRASMAAPDADSGMISVDTGAFSCVFFPGHMFPIRFRLPSGAEMPRPEAGDRLTRQKESYRLASERWAETVLTENTDERLTVECRGTFCAPGDERPAPGSVEAVYRYTFRRNSGAVDIRVRLTRADDTSWDEATTLDFRWRAPADKPDAPRPRASRHTGEVRVETTEWLLTLRGADADAVTDANAPGLRGARRAPWDTSTLEYAATLRFGAPDIDCPDSAGE